MMQSRTAPGQDGRRHRLKTRPVCVAASEWLCTVEGDEILRIGFNYVKGLAEAHVQAMLAERRARPFDSMADFLRRTRFTATERRALATSAAGRQDAPVPQISLPHAPGGTQGDTCIACDRVRHVR